MYSINKKLIITADDYGMSKAVNEAIDKGIEAGLITATNLMTNMPYCQEGRKYSNDKRVSMGLHWCISCGEPISKQEDIPTLIDPTTGEFYKYPIFRERFRKGKIKKRDIMTELIAQYDKFVEIMGGEPDYWNTHQNSHVDFVVYQLFVDIACQLHINRMRSHQRIYVPCSKKEDMQPLLWRVIEPLKSRLIDRWQKVAHKKGINSPNGLIVCLNNADINRLDYVFQNIKWENNRIGEYVIHPATHRDSKYFGKIVDQRVREYEMFTSQETEKQLKLANIELVTYYSI